MRNDVWYSLGTVTRTSSMGESSSSCRSSFSTSWQSIFLSSNLSSSMTSSFVMVMARCGTGNEVGRCGWRLGKKRWGWEWCLGCSQREKNERQVPWFYSLFFSRRWCIFNLVRSSKKHKCIDNNHGQVGKNRATQNVLDPTPGNGCMVRTTVITPELQLINNCYRTHRMLQCW